MKTATYALELPLAMADDEAAVRAAITQRADAAGNVVAPDAVIVADTVPNSLGRSGSVLLAKVTVTPMRLSVHGVLHHPACRFIEGGLPNTAIPDQMTPDQVASARRCGRCLPERPQT